MLSHAVAQLPRFLTLSNAVFLLQALGTTLLLTAIGCSVGLIAGFALAILRGIAGPIAAPFRAIAIVYVELFRRIPFLVTLLLVFYAAQLSGLDAPLFAIAAVSVCLIATAYLSEVARAGLLSVHRNQWDSAALANMSHWQTLYLVVIPQSWRVFLPPAFAFFLMFLKDSALASQIGVTELAFAGKVLNNRGFVPLLSWGSVLLLYFALSYPLTRLGRFLEARLGRTPHR